ncbi:MAG: leucyl/phenylalanyl-tRNA--protein transferase [Bacteroidota bacterium]
MPIYRIPDDLVFPPVSHAEPSGILGIGGDLSAERLLLAYESGIFPWFSDDEPVLWWAPDPRFVLFPAKLKVSKSMKQILKKGMFQISYDQAFEEVIQACAQIYRPGQRGTWITDEMKEAYAHLHQLGLAHSVEVYQEGELVGGLYGVSLGNCFFGESMFSKVSNASKTGFISLVRELEQRKFCLIDCQVHTGHLESLGAEMIPRNDFMEFLHDSAKRKSIQGNWGELFSK